jgi:type I restriction enzyme S subunit
VRAPVGRLNIADRKLILGRGLCGIRHRKGFQNYAYYLLQDVFKIEDSFGNGAVFNAVSKSELSKIKVIIPHQKVEKKFQEYVKPLDQEILLLTQKNQVLQETRDLLLPRLISGKLNVEELDIAEPTT